MNAIQWTNTIRNESLKITTVLSRLDSQITSKIHIIRGSQ